MPRLENCPEGKPGWEKVNCPVCGDPCWKRPEDAGVIEKSKLDGAACTLCALKKGPFEPEDIRQCVYIERREVMGKEYIDCKPAYCRKRWYMMGGNFLYTSDSRFKEITGISYPIAIHDRYEGR